MALKHPGKTAEAMAERERQRQMLLDFMDGVRLYALADLVERFVVNGTLTQKRLRLALRELVSRGDLDNVARRGHMSIYRKTNVPHPLQEHWKRRIT